MLSKISGQRPEDRLDIIARVFKARLDYLVADIKKKKKKKTPLFWPCCGYFVYNWILKKGFTTCALFSLARKKWQD